MKPVLELIFFFCNLCDKLFQFYVVIIQNVCVGLCAKSCYFFCSYKHEYKVLDSHGNVKLVIPFIVFLLI